MSAEKRELERTISGLEAQRGLLGDDIVDKALALLRTKLDSLVKAPADPTAVARTLRQVSILFIDTVGSTKLSQQLHPEEVSDVMDRALSRFAAIIEQHGGKVLSFAGDSVMAAFGAVRAVEDDPERAVRAGLALLIEGLKQGELIRQRLPDAEFNVRVGVNTGDVLLGGGVDAESSIRGQAVNIAARMEQSAPVGTLRISHDTWVHVRGLFETEAQPPLTVKGSDKPLLTYLVRSAVSASFRRVNRGLDGVASPMVGRDAELNRLLECFDAVGRTGTLHAATVLADAGIGKSRLLHEFREALKRRQSRYTMLLARARPSSALQPYGLLREMLATWLQIADDESADVARRKLVEGLAPLCPERGEMHAHLIGRLIGLDFVDSPHLAEASGPALRERGFRALRLVLQGLAAREGTPLLVLLDDLHWADDGSLDFVHKLVTDGPALPLLLISGARPSLLERRPTWLEAASNHQRLPLSLLDAAQGRALALALLQRVREVPASLQRLLIDRAAGNPYYMEELVRMLLDDGAIVVAPDGGWVVAAERLQALKVPDTLVGVLQARLDAQPDAERRALQHASIVGPVFWDDVLAAIDAAATAALPTLLNRALIQARTTSAFEGTAEHVFQHQLLHDVTYGTVLRAMRQRGHAAAARWLAERVADRSGEFLAITAEHFERAGDSAQALDYYARAARDAVYRDAFIAADAYLQRALAQPASIDARLRFDLLNLNEIVSYALGRKEANQAAVDAMVQWAEQCDDDAMRASALSTRMLQADRRGDKAGAAALARRCIETGARADMPEPVTLAHGELAWLAIVDRRFSDGDFHLQQGFEWAERAAARVGRENRVDKVRTQLRVIAIESLISQGRLSDATSEIEGALESAIDPAARPSVYDRCSLLQRRSMVAQQLGDLDAAQQAASEELAFARQIDMLRLQGIAMRDLAEVARCRGDAAEQHRLASKAMEIAQEGGYASDAAKSLLLQGDALVELGETATAVTRLTEVAALMSSHARHDQVAVAVARRAEAHRRAGDLSRAVADVDATLAGAVVMSEMETRAVSDCWRVLDAAADPRSEDLLDEMHRRLQNTLSPLPEGLLRERLLSLPHWRETVAAWQLKHAGDGAKTRSAT